MKQNIGNNKEKTLNTKTLLKMRIELENIYESKEKSWHKEREVLL